jgi:hypothetical protein
MRDLWSKHLQKHQTCAHRKTKRGKRAILDMSRPIPLRERPPSKPRAAKCFCCGRNIGSAGWGDSPWECPSGAVLFSGGGNFGSTLYDSFVDGVRVTIIVCDECLRSRGKRGLEWYQGTNDDQPNKEAMVKWFSCGQSWPSKESAKKAWRERSKS